MKVISFSANIEMGEVVSDKCFLFRIIFLVFITRAIYVSERKLLILQFIVNLHIARNARATVDNLN